MCDEKTLTDDAASVEGKKRRFRLPVLIESKVIAAGINVSAILAWAWVLLLFGQVLQFAIGQSLIAGGYFWTTGSPSEVQHYEHQLWSVWLFAVSAAIVVLNLFVYKHEFYKTFSWMRDGVFWAVNVTFVICVVFLGFDWEILFGADNQSLNDIVGINGSPVFWVGIAAVAVGAYAAYKKWIKAINVGAWALGYFVGSNVVVVAFVMTFTYGINKIQHSEEEGYVYPAYHPYCTDFYLTSPLTGNPKKGCWAENFVTDGDKLSLEVTRYMRARRGSFTELLDMPKRVMPLARTEAQQAMLLDWMGDSYKHLDHAARMPKADSFHEHVPVLTKENESEAGARYGFIAFSHIWLDPFSDREMTALEYHQAVLAELKAKNGEGYWRHAIERMGWIAEGQIELPINFLLDPDVYDDVLAWGLEPSKEQIETLQTLKDSVPGDENLRQKVMVSAINRILDWLDNRKDKQKAYWSADRNQGTEKVITWEQIETIEAKFKQHGFNIKGLDKE